MGLLSGLKHYFTEPSTTNVVRVETEYEKINRSVSYSVASRVKAEIEESRDPEVTTAFVRSVANRTLHHMTRYETNGKYTAEMLDMIMNEIEIQCAELNRNYPEWAGVIDQPRYPTCDWFAYRLYTEVTE